MPAGGTAKDPTDAAELAARDVRKSFGGVRALKGVSASLPAGSVVSLVGENGSGKSTLLSILSGIRRPDTGQVLARGEPVDFRNPADAIARRISLVPQDMILASHLSVAENVWLGHLPGGRIVSPSVLGAETKRVLSDLLGLTLDPSLPVRRLRPDQQSLVVICRACAWKPRVLLLDEPTASLTDDGVERLMRLLARLRDEGVAIAFTSHRLREHLRIADRVVILRDGELVADKAISETSEDEMVRLMVGRALPEFLTKESVTIGPPRLEVRDLRLRPAAQPIDFDVRAGEIVGLGGLAGSGRSRLARIIAGAQVPASGTIRVDGRPLTLGSVPNALAQGIGLLPEDRKSMALLLPLSIRENITISILRRLRRFGVVRRREERRIARHFLTRLAIRAPSIETPVRNLSGGNQQKVVVARLLAADVGVLVLDEPTKGIDVGAKAEMFRLIGQAAADGRSVIFVSSELPELLGLSDRILVLREGSVVADLPRDQATEERVVAAAVGAAAA